jgi:hypothetical protein
MGIASTAAGHALLVAAVVASGCTYSADFDGARFACDTLTPCPDGVACIDGYCPAAGPVDGSIGGEDRGDDDQLDGGLEGGGVTWRSAAVGRVDNDIFNALSTSDTGGVTGGPGARRRPADRRHRGQRRLGQRPRLGGHRRRDPRLSTTSA